MSNGEILSKVANSLHPNAAKQNAIIRENKSEDEFLSPCDENLLSPSELEPRADRRQLAHPQHDLHIEDYLRRIQAQDSEPADQSIEEFKQTVRLNNGPNQSCDLMESTMPQTRHVP